VSIFSNTRLFSQGYSEAAIPFLPFPVSPSINSTGGAASSIPTDDPYGFLFNPAQLGYFGSVNNFAIALPSTMELASITRIEISSMAVSLGYNFKNKYGIPLSVGLGYSRPQMSFGKIFVTDPESPDGYFFTPRDYYHTFSIGFGYDNYLQFNGGLSIKSITSEFSSDITADASAFDLGLLINAPLIRMLNKDISFSFAENTSARPFADFSIGYTLQNLADKIYYIDPGQADPLPRLAKLGYGISGGIDLMVESSIFNLFRISFTSEAEDLLVTRDSVGSSYQSGIGDIIIGRNIFGAKGDDNVFNKSGVKIDLLDVFSYRSGKYSGRGLHEGTNGIEIRAKGFLKFLAITTQAGYMKYIADHFDLKYYNTTYPIGFTTDNYPGLVFVINNFNIY